jgi:SAM-dependent methyltransferase
MGFEWAYRSGTPAWDIDGPQPAVAALAEAGRISGSVLDVGCGTGENALYLAGLGLAVTGVDAAPTAIQRAREKAVTRGLAADFRVADALRLAALGREFDAAIDCGLFHTFTDADRPAYERSIHGVLRPGGSLFVLCFSDAEPGGWGPRRVTQAEIRETFGAGWTVEEIVATRFATHVRGGAAAWLASLTRR